MSALTSPRIGGVFGEHQTFVLTFFTSTRVSRAAMQQAVDSYNFYRKIIASCKIMDNGH
jgi:hypothetical protein